MPENDQTRWIGIRPVNPAENIPTTSKKLTPAIADLQAIKGIYQAYQIEISKNCSVEYTCNLPSVDAGEIWVVTNASIKNVVSLCDLVVCARQAAITTALYTYFSVEPKNEMVWNGQCFLEEGDNIKFVVKLGGVSDSLVIYANGYKIGVY